jgi:hypothetical protein
MKNKFFFILISLTLSKPTLYPEQVSVSIGKELCVPEASYLQKRASLVTQATKDFIQNQNVSILPRISFGFSGGGYRSMICCAGFTDGANNIGLDKIASYQAAISGSSWFLANYLVRNLPPQAFGEILQKRVATSFVDPKTLDITAILKKLCEKDLSHGSIGPVDLWGALLADRLMGDLGAQNALNFSFDNIRKTLYYTNKHAYPLFNSIISNVYPYIFVDMSPFDCRMIGLSSACSQAYIPTTAFSSPFESGASKKILTEESLSFFIGILGSPYNISLGDIFYDIAYSSGNEMFKSIVAWMIKEFDLYNVRVLSSPVYNFMYNYSDQPLKSFETVNFTDAGASFVNIPFPALLKKERANDILIVCDASTDAGDKGYPEMVEASDYAKKHGLKFPPIKNPRIINKDLAIFEDQNDPLVPTVAYFSNPDKTSTLKFDYSKEEFDKLYGTMKNLVMASKAVLVDVIKNKIKIFENCRVNNNSIEKRRQGYLAKHSYVPAVYYKVPDYYVTHGTPVKIIAKKQEEDCFDQFATDLTDEFNQFVDDLSDKFNDICKIN